MKSLLANKKQILAVVVFLVFVYLMMDLNNRLTELFRLTHQRDQMRSEVLALKRTEQGLHTDVGYATSDAAVRKWAYEYADKAQPGDSIIVPLPQENYTPPAPTQFVPTTRPVENWEVWRALFFGE